MATPADRRRCIRLHDGVGFSSRELKGKRTTDAGRGAISGMMPSHECSHAILGAMGHERELRRTNGDTDVDCNRNQLRHLRQNAITVALCDRLETSTSCVPSFVVVSYSNGNPVLSLIRTTAKHSLIRTRRSLNIQHILQSTRVSYMHLIQHRKQLLKSFPKGPKSNRKLRWPLRNGRSHLTQGKKVI